MATNISTIGAGQDYTTITAWEAAVQGDLVTAGNIEKGEMINQAFTERVTIDGSTTDASNYLWLTVASGAAHDGTPGGGPRIAPTSGTGHLLTISDPFTRIEGIEFDLSNTTGASDECIRINQDNALIRNCLLHTDTARTNQDGIYIGPSNSWTFTVENCCIHGFSRAGIHLQNWTGSASVTGNIRNCTIYNCGHEAEGSNGTPGGIGAHENDGAGATTNVNVDNTIALNNTTGTGCEDFNVYSTSTPNWTGDGNISSDTSCQTRFGAQTANLNSRTATANASPGAGDWVIFTNITAGSEDYHLQDSAENDALGNGINLSAFFTDDFDGDTRSNWDSGFDELVAGGGLTLNPTGIASAEAFGSPTLAVGPVTIAPSSLAGAEAFGSPTLAPGPVSVSPGALPSAEAFGSPTLVLGAVAVIPDGLATAEAFGSSILLRGPVVLLPTGLATAEAFGAPQLNQLLSVTGLATAEAFGSPTLLPGAVSLLPASLASGEAFGSPTLSAGTLFVAPASLASAEAFGSPTLVVGGVVILPNGLPTGEAFGSPSLVPGAVNLQPDALPSGEAFGAPTLSIGSVLLPVGLASGEAFGSAALVPGGVNLLPNSVPSAEAFGSPTLSSGVLLQPAGLASGEGFGGTTLTPGAVVLLPTGLATSQAFGNLTLIPGPIILSPDGLATAEAFGVPSVLFTVSPTGLASGEAFGSPTLTPGPVIIQPDGLASAEAFGSFVIELLSGKQFFVVAQSVYQPGLTQGMVYAPGLKAGKVSQ